MIQIIKLVVIRDKPTIVAVNDTNARLVLNTLLTEYFCKIDPHMNTEKRRAVNPGTPKNSSGCRIERYLSVEKSTPKP